MSLRLVQEQIKYTDVLEWQGSQDATGPRAELDLTSPMAGDKKGHADVAHVAQAPVPGRQALDPDTRDPDTADKGCSSPEKVLAARAAGSSTLSSTITNTVAKE